MSESRLNNEELKAPITAYPPRASVENWTSSVIALEEECDESGRGVAAAKDSYTDADYANADFVGPLFADAELKSFRDRWDQVQASFVDAPREAVRNADSLVANVVQRIEDQFAQERSKLEKQWESGTNASTEEMRQAIKRYRALFGRLLTF